jgi:hypothetical protein
MPLTPEQIDALLQKDANKRLGNKPTTGSSGGKHKLIQLREEETKVQTRRGPLRWYDKPDKCMSRNCRIETYIKVDGIAYCTHHALVTLNETIVRMTEERFEVVRGGRSDFPENNIGL